MKRSSKEQNKNNTPAPKRSGRVETIDVVYKCGHKGQRREIVYEHVDVMHQLRWIKRNVVCGECGRVNDV